MYERNNDRGNDWRNDAKNERTISETTTTITKWCDIKGISMIELLGHCNSAVADWSCEGKVSTARTNPFSTMNRKGTAGCSQENAHHSRIGRIKLHMNHRGSLELFRGFHHALADLDKLVALLDTEGCFNNLIFQKFHRARVTVAILLEELCMFQHTLRRHQLFQSLVQQLCLWIAWTQHNTWVYVMSYHSKCVTADKVSCSKEGVATPPVLDKQKDIHINRRTDNR